MEGGVRGEQERVADDEMPAGRELLGQRADLSHLQTWELLGTLGSKVF